MLCETGRSERNQEAVVFTYIQRLKVQVLQDQIHVHLIIPTPSDLPASVIEDLPVLIHQRIVSVSIGEHSIS